MEPIYIVLIVLAAGLFYIDKYLKKKFEMPRSIIFLHFVNKTHKNVFFFYAFSSIIAIFAAQVEVERNGEIMSLIWLDPFVVLAIILYVFCAIRSYFVKKYEQNEKEANYFSSWGIVALVYGLVIFWVDYFLM